MLSRVLGEDITLEFQLRKKIFPPFMAIRACWNRSSLNLVVNARDAMPHGGRLRIGHQHGQFYVRGSLPNPGCLSQEDSSGCPSSDAGSGIAPEIRERIFEPFFTDQRSG